MGRTTGKVLLNILMLLAMHISVSETASTDCREGSGANYYGSQNVTVSGRFCQRWDQQRPHRQSCYRTLNVSEAENYCRNPDGCQHSMPWCYTMDSASQWEYCDVPHCGYEQPTCTRALGMQDERIADGQLSASRSWKSDTSAKYARFNSSVAAWVARGGSNEYLQIDLAALHKVTAVLLQGGGTACNCWTRSFKILFSANGYSWQFYKSGEVLEGNAGRNHAIRHTLDPPIVASHIAMVPVSYTYLPALRIELFGCSVNEQVSTATNVTEDITVNTYWDFNHSPYIIHNTVKVAYAATLTIQAGVKVIFTNKDQAFIIEGCLKSEGLPGLAVKFQPASLANYLTKGRVYWKGIQAISTVGSCAKMDLRYIFISGAETALYTTIQHVSLSWATLENNNKAISAVKTVTLSIDNSQIVNNNQYGVNCEVYGNVSFVNTTFSENNVGVNFRKVGNQESIVRVDNCHFIGKSIGFDANNIGRYVVSIIFTNSYFYGINTGLRMYGHVNNLNVLVASCIFDSTNKRYATAMNVNMYSGQGQIRIVNSTSTNGYSGFTLASYVRTFAFFLNDVTMTGHLRTALSFSGEPSEIVVENSTFNHNRANVMQLSNIRDQTQIAIRYNTLVYNSGTNVIYIKRTITKNASDTVIQGNAFVNNTVSSSTLYIQGNLPGSSQCTHNIFHNPDTAVELDVGSQLHSGYKVDARYNWWGTTNTSDIQQRVRDFFTDSGRVESLLSPIYSTDALNSDHIIDFDRNWQMVDGTVGGRINQDMELFLDDMTVTRTIHIPAETKLILHLHGQLLFQNSTGILVEGNLDLQGDFDNVGILKPSAKNKWGGLRFIKSYGSQIKNCIITNGDTCLNLETSSLSVNDSEISNCHKGIYGSASGAYDLRLVNVTVRQNREDGVYFHFPSNKNSNMSLFMERCRMESNGKTGVRLGSKHMHVHVKQCSFLYNAYQQVYMRFDDGNFTAEDSSFTSKPNRIYYDLVLLQYYMNTRGGRRTVDVRNSNFHTDGNCCLNVQNYHPTLVITLLRNVFTSKHRPTLDIDSRYSAGSKITMDRNSFTCPRTVTTRLIVTAPRKLHITANNFTESRGALQIELSATGDNDAMFISRNIFARNSGAWVIHVKSTRYKSTSEIRQNTFTNNTATSIVVDNGYSVSILENLFDNPSTQYDLEVTTPFNEQLMLYAERNWWGSSDYGYISHRIHDNSKQSSLLKVDYVPYLTERDLSSISKQSDGFFRSETDIGGVLSQDEILEARSTPYVVVEDIIIPRGLSLTIEAGVQLSFLQGGVTVEGQLIVNGETMMTAVTFAPAPGVLSWKGIFFKRLWEELVRLRGGQTTREGSVEMFLNGRWSPICSYNWGMQQADILCKQLGFVNGALQVNDGSRYVNETDGEAEWRLHCNNDVSDLMECDHYSCYSSYRKRHAGVVCKPNNKVQKLDSIGILETKIGSLKVTYNESRTIVLKQSGALFHMLRPGLTKESNTVSFMSYDKPGWYIRHYNSELHLEPYMNPRDMNTFKADATFYEHTDKFDDGYTAFEPVNRLGMYIVHGIENSLHVSTVNTSELQDNASFIFMQGNKRYKRSVSDDTGTSNHQAIGSPNSSISYAVVINASEGIVVKGKPPLLRGVTVVYSHKNALNFLGYLQGLYMIDECKFMNSETHGIYVTAKKISQDTKIVIENCSIRENKKSGIYVSSSVNMTIRNNSIDWNGDNGIQLYYLKQNIVNITSNVLYGNQPSALRTQRCSAQRLLFADNIVSNNTLNIRSDRSTVHIDTMTHNHVEITGNMFEYNHQFFVYYSWGRKLVRGSTIYLGSGSSIRVKIQNNRFENGIGNGVIALHTGIGSCIDCHITGNTFINNSQASSSDIMVTVAIQYESNVVLRNNVFSNPMAKFELKVPAYGDVVDASYNYWDRQLHSDIVERIDCFYNNMDLTRVLLWPFFSTPQLDLLTYPPSDYGFSSSTLGGDVVDNITLQRQQNPYKIDRSIFISENASLKLMPGVELRFAPGRGVRARGDFNVHGTKESLIFLRGKQEARWYGVIAEKSSKSGDFGFMHLSTTTKGLELFQDNVRMRNVTINSTSQGVIFHGDGHLSIENCTFMGNANAVRILGKHADISITTSNFIQNQLGLTINERRSLVVHQCLFAGHSNIAFRINHGQREPATIMIDSCTFKENVRQSLYATLPYDGNASIVNNQFFNSIARTECVRISAYKNSLLIQNNTFHKISKNALIVTNAYTTNLNRTIKGNVFNKTQGIALTINYCERSFYKIENNLFVYNENVNGPSALHYVCNNPRGQIRFNDFSENRGVSIVELRSSRVLGDMSITANTFYKNSVSDAVITTSTYVCNITYNMFSNPASRYDLAITYRQNQTLNATYNWWGEANREFVVSRITNSLNRVLYEPFLLSPEISCNNKNNCSGHGDCVKPETCECHAGWKGPTCSQYSCREVNECQGRGTCVGSNMCNCKKGWLPPNCVHATCYNINNCSGHGLCISPDRCHCAENFQGEQCDTCISDHWGPQCLPCPKCVHGSCDFTTGKCVCEGKNWAGSLCNKCAEKFYGKLCEPLTKVIDIAPNRGPDIGGTVIRVRGHNFIQLKNGTDYYCRFGTKTTVGTWVSDEEIICKAPAHPASTVYVEISYDANKPFTDDKVPFTFYAICPISACGSTEKPARGICSMAKCLCVKPWTGDDCEILGLSPKISHLLPQRAKEGETVKLQLSISEGTEPVDWNLAVAPSGAILDGQKTTITWVTRARAEPWRFVVEAVNEFGSGNLEFTISVNPSYTATLDPLPRGPLKRAVPILISGKVNFVDGSPLTGMSVPVQIVINSNIGERIITTDSLPTSNVFYRRFYPSPREVGFFEAYARHPVDRNFVAQTRWSVYGFRVAVSPLSLAGYLGTHRFNLTLRNVGVDTLTHFVMQKTRVPFRMTIEKDIVCQLNNYDCKLTELLAPNDEIVFTIKIVVNQPIRGYFEVRVLSNEGITKSTSVRFNFQAKLPKFVASPSSIVATVTRGKRYTYTINVNNAGLRSATGVHVQLPNEPLLSLVSFAKPDQDVDEESFSMLPEHNATLVLAITVPSTEPLGKRNGRIVIRSLETSLTLYYRFVVTSSDELDLTVSVEDEYTYFSEDKPRLEGATVTLRSKLRDFSFKQVTNESGIVIFRGIQEDYYSLYSRADKHIGDTRVILATPSDNNVRVFLQRTAVTYSWVVTRVTFEDRYDINLEADFETSVPMPVVTITPRQLDLEILQRGLMPVINFELTNHGLIRADDVNFKLPAIDSHPFMHLEMAMEKIGNIAANTTIQVPVRVIVNEDKKKQYIGEYPGTVTKRSNPIACLALAIYAGYKYLCDRERFNQLSVPIKNAMNRNCGGGAGTGTGTGRSAGGYWSGYSSYSSGPSSSQGSIAVSQPLTCDEVINCLKATYRCYKAAKTTIKCLKSLRAIKIPYVGPLYVIFKCYKVYGSIKRCRKEIKKCRSSGGGSSSRRKRRGVLNQDDLAPDMAIRYIAATNQYELAEIVVNDTRWFDTNSGDWWSLAVQPMLADNSEQGQLVTNSEFEQIQKFPLPTNVTRQMANNLIRRLNNSYYNWDHGVLEGENMISHKRYSTLEKQIASDEAKAKEAGYNSMADFYEDSLADFEGADSGTDDGVCAKVRIRIQQRLALTRDAFKATLELENGESVELTGIRVEIQIYDYDTKENALHKFAIGKPEVTGMGSVDGHGSLAVKNNGKAEWLIIPYSEAAPTQDTRYDIGGTLYYTVDGENITVPLFPDTITVKPDPRLYLNYFLEKYVKSDDAMTKDVVEPTVPFSLGILITNDGYGPAKNLRITSGQPEIIENEKGLLINFKIIGAQLGREPISPSLTVTFGDISPKSTAMARWLMTSSLKGTFSNYSATFENTNPLGDPQLSVMESVRFHELLHVVWLDFPEDDDLPDFLVLSETKLDVIPDRIFQSSDGRNPLNVSFTNITSIAHPNNGKMQVTVFPTQTGWVYFRGDYTNQENIRPTQAIRSDNGHSVKVGYNLWIEDLNDKSYLHILDYIDQAGKLIVYTIHFKKSNLHKPRFSQSEYSLRVQENGTAVHNIFNLTVTDEDTDQTIEYSIDNYDKNIYFPFRINDTTGRLWTTGKLDRETVDFYTFSIVATDNGTPPRKSSVPVKITVLDKNDNAPVFVNGLESVFVEEDIDVGYHLTYVTAIDADEGDNGMVEISFLNKTLPFAYNVGNGTLNVKESLRGDVGVYSLLFEAVDNGTPARKTTLTLTIHVVKTNRFSPTFEQLEYRFQISEAVNVGKSIDRIIATDKDGVDSVVSYYIVQQPDMIIPFKVDSSTGDVITLANLDRESKDSYKFQVLASDNGAQPTGPKTGTAVVNIEVTDVNDNAPEFHADDYTVYAAEDIVVNSVIFRSKVTDNDLGLIANISFHESSSDLPFRLATYENNGELALFTTQLLDAEVRNAYEVVLLAVDNGNPPMQTSITVNVWITDVNDNPPIFEPSSKMISLSRSTVANTLIFSAHATDDDISEEYSKIKYKMTRGETEYLTLNSDTGAMRLAKSLPAAPQTKINVVIEASSGLDTAEFELVINIVDNNRYAPVFSKQDYTLYVNESAPSGAEILQLQATDADSATIEFSILTGNEDNVFALNPFTGIISLLGQLDHETVTKHTLVLSASDGGVGGGVDVLTNNATVHIHVLDTNEYSPEFTDGVIYQIEVAENSSGGIFMKLNASDGDGDNISYSINNADSRFSIDASTGTIEQKTLLDRETEDEIRLEVVASDDGVPARSSTAEVFISVTDINDNMPIFEHDLYRVSINVTNQRTLIFTAVASDADAGINAQLRYFLVQSASRFFSIKEDSGEIFASKDITSGDYELQVSARDGGVPSFVATMTLQVSVKEVIETTTETTIEVTSDEVQTTAESGSSSVTQIHTTFNIVALVIIFVMCLR